MKSKAIRISVLIILLVILSISFTSCLSLRLNKKYAYDADWMIGKTSFQIQEKFGQFNYTSADRNEDGLYYNCECGYYTFRGEGIFYNGVIWQKYLILHFNEDGIVYKISEKLDHYKT